MSAIDSDDEFALNGPSTPNIPKRINPSTSKTRAGNNVRAEAGPSRTGNTNTSNKRKKGVIVATQEQSDDDEVQEVPMKRGNPGQNARGKPKQTLPIEEEEAVLVEEDEDDSSTNDVEVVDLPPTVKGRGGSKKPAKAPASGSNGHTKPHTTKLTVETAKNKGKQKAKAMPVYKRHEPEPMDVDLEDVVDMDTEDDLERDAAEGQARLAQAINKSGRSGGIKPETRHDSPHSKKDAQFARLEKQLQQAQENIKDLQRQLDEFNQVRMTEPEQLMERMQFQHQAQNELRDSYVADLRSELAKRDPLLKSGKKSAFELLTREEANNEMQSLHQRLKDYQDVIRQRDARLELQEKEIESLQEDKRILDVQLKEEVRRTKELSARAPPSSSKPRTGGLLSSVQDPKITQVISFYEDLTNVIVPSMKNVPGRYFGLEEWILNCCYTHKDVVNPAEPSTKSINFNLRLCFEPRPNVQEPTTKDDLVQSVHYTPLELQNESEEFVHSLGFLGDNFTFERDQLALFSRTLHDYVSGEGDDSKSDGNPPSDDSVQVVG